MKALTIHAAEDIRWADAPEVEPGEHEVRLRVAYVGICGSDLHYYFHGANGAFVITEPLIPGHELSAVVDLDPSGEFAPGTPVTVHPARYGTSAPDIEDRPHLWPGGDYLGSASVTPHRQGAAAEYLVIDRENLRRLPESLPLRRGALAEPLAVALHAVTIAGDVTGKKCLVLGAGPIGLLAVAALLHRGAASVDVTDVRPEPLQRAKSLGASETILVTETGPEDNAYDVVLECSSAPVSLSSGVRAVRPAGIIVQVAILPNTDIPVNLAALVAKEVQLRGTQRFDGEIDEAIEVLAADARFDAVVTQVLPAADAVEAFATAKDASRSAKVLLEL
ncbi:L-idonate 5-dehydrogenase [Brachybacterium alimentarium]|uniref:L-idonate 5-dehydrogenase n=1 Tax=Brachybacterium alimentarium TaxID=47845 RepID=UPI000DF22F3D|nr:L-idonate 5-dehydrogenase [Brachybacterium alimentarium]RCS71159.1 L-idonate 5-dehydrogenase [Brachybacterium alimentarium]RCS74626.1 L-idonate 5-dehydrogenase [Brachybacterium alimentarium]RCS81584.1 L-idonate 5-dehydrogenase [Brachybacterium alimentarium]RCS82136.1 L-idonate 5-dehydrogenase [Brachybacterium alimentarium]RCS90474.1 L-idonate 5-dehydrogenase [Brachybacterium alimentarium]